MEESEKRRQRLLAMRMEADQVAASRISESEVGNDESEASRNNGAQAGPNSHLFNPLLGTSEVQGSHSTARFDFYTDPLAAFSSNRQRNTHNVQNSRFSSHDTGSSPSPMMQFPRSFGPNNLEVAPTHVDRPDYNISSGKGTHQSDDPHGNSEIAPPGAQSEPWNSISFNPTMYQAGHPNGNPLEKTPDFSPHIHHTQNNHWPIQPMHQAAAPRLNSGPTTSPNPMMISYPMEQGTPLLGNAMNYNQQWLPQTSPGSGAASSHYSRNSPRFSPASGPGYYQGGSPYVPTPYQGRGQQFVNSPGGGPGGKGSPHFGGGIGRWSGNQGSPSSGFGGRGGRGSPHFGGRGNGRWSGSHSSPSSGHSGGRAAGPMAGFSNRGFYQKSMVEDPWQSLKPVKWSAPNTSKMPLRFRTPQPAQESHSVKKPRVSHACDDSGSKQSLADFLAEAFDEAVGDNVAV